MDARCRIELFGWLRVSPGDRVITRFPTRQTGALLAYLAFYGHRSHPRDLLMELLWPEDTLSTDRHKLRKALTSLRHQLEPPGVPPGAVILADRDTIRLNPATVTTDVAEFEAALAAAARARSAAERMEQWQTAVERYRGELLPGRFEEWVLPERQRLDEAYQQTLRRLLSHTEASGDLPRALDYARRAVAADPLREEAQQELIRLLAATGQQEAARRHYRELAARLERELGVVPSREIQRLVGEIEDEKTPTRHGGSLTHSGPESGQIARGEPQEREPTLLSARPVPLDSHSAASSSSPMLPSGTVTFLLVDDEAGPAGRTGIERLRPLFRGHGGHEAPGAGETLTAVFGRATDALAAAVAGQRALQEHRVSFAGPGEPGSAPSSSLLIPDPFRPRMALHTGEVPPGDSPERGPALLHASRLLRAAHPGQILLSAKSAALLQDELPPGLRLADLGRYGLRDLAEPETLFQVEDAEIGPQAFPPPRLAPVEAGSLPLRLTRFFGREAELEQLERLVREEQRRLVTLTGPGGSGKTRLAIELAETLRNAFHGAVWFVALADLSDPRLVPDKLADALRLARVPGIEPLEQVVAFLSSRCLAGSTPVLLILDNFEQLADGGVSLLNTLLARVERLTLLVTSRRRLELPGEREFVVAPLPVPVDGPWPLVDRPKKPDPSHPSDPSEPSTLNPQPSTLSHQRSTWLECASVRLFVDRAQAARPDFQVTPGNAAAVAGISIRLEGIPLAIELAAARAQVVTPAQMLARLENRFELLTSRQRGIAERHRSLWAALAWSYEMLSPPLQRFFTRLSVFRGGWTAEAAEEVCEEPAARDHLIQLRGCSLVQVEEAGTEMRLRMLETVREYAWEQLSRAEQDALRGLHAVYFLSWAQRAEPELWGPDQAAWLERLDREQGNLRAALDWCQSTQDAQTGLDLCLALGQYWWGRSLSAEGEERLSALLAMPGPEPVTRAKALARAGTMAWQQREYARARELCEEALAIGREFGDKAAIAAALTGLAATIANLGEIETARTLDQQSLALYRELGDQPGAASVLCTLGTLALFRSDYAAARAYLEESLAISREMADRGHIGSPLYMLGVVCEGQCDFEAAQGYLEESAALYREVGNRARLALSLQSLGWVALRQNDGVTARQRIEESLALWREVNDPWGIPTGLTALAAACHFQGERETARALYSDVLATWRETGSKAGVAVALLGLGKIALDDRGDAQEALPLMAECLMIRQELGDRRAIAECLEGMAEALGVEGDSERAARLLGAADAIRKAIGAPIPPYELSRHARASGAARAVMGEEAVAAAWAEGESMTLEEVVAYAVEGSPSA